MTVVECSCGVPGCMNMGFGHDWDPIAAGDSCSLSFDHKVTEPYVKHGSGYACVGCLPEDDERRRAHERLEAAAGVLRQAVATCHERVACPMCEAPVGALCRALPRGFTGRMGRELKWPHGQRILAAGIPLR